MGMTIDDCFKRMSDIRKNYDRWTGLTPNESEAFDLVADIMRKYQRIEQIADKCNLKLLPKEGMSTFQKDVLEVLEDD